MATVNWAVEADGDWRTRADWSTGKLPTGADDVVLSTAGAFTITQSTGADTAGSITATTDRLAISGGSLRVLGTASVAAGLTLSGGTLILAGGADVAGGLVATGGTLALAASTVASVAGASLSGKASLTGLGTLATSGATTVGPDGSALLMGGGITWDNGGVATIGGRVLSASAAHIVNAAGARFALTADTAGIISTGGGATFANAGTLAKTGGVGTSEIDSTLSSTGTISVASGTLLLTSGGAIGGTLGGAGTLELGAASSTALASLSGDGTLLSTGLLRITNTTVTLGVDLIQQGGTLSLSTGATLTTAANLDVRDGATITGAATLATAGVTTIGADASSIYLRGGITLTNAGTVTVSGGILTLNAATLINAAGAQFVLATDAAGIVADGGNSQFDNAGTLAKTGGTGTSEIDSTLTSTGTISVASGTLLLTSGGTIGGILGGAGTLELGAVSTTALSNLSGDGTLLSTALLRVTNPKVTLGVYLTQQGGTLSLATGATLTTTANLDVRDGATITGAATLATAGATAIGADASSVYLRGISWINADTVTVSGGILTLGGATVVNAAGAQFVLATDAAGIIADGGNSQFDNVGTLAKAGGVGTSEIDSTLSSTGTISVASGTLLLTSGGAIGGTLGGAGTLELGTVSTTALASLSGDGTLLSTGLLRVTATKVTLGVDLTQQGGTLSLATGATLTTTANLDVRDGATITGAATLITAGATTIGADGSTLYLRGITWRNAGVAIASGGIVTVNAATLVNTAAARLVLATDAAGIIAEGGRSSFDNAGTLAKTGGAGTSEIDSVLTSTGTIAVGSGTLLLTGNATIGGTLSGAGTLELAGGTNQVNGLAATPDSTLVLATGSGVSVSGSALGGFAMQGQMVVAGNDSVSGGFTQIGGGLYIGGTFTLELDGGASIQGGAAISGRGTLSSQGGTTIAADGAAVSLTNIAWSNGGSVVIDGAIDSGGAAQYANAAGASFGFGADGAGILDTGGKSTLANAGTLAILAGGGTSVVDSVLTSTGAIIVAAGTTLDLDGGGTIGGAIDGAGTLLFGGGNFSVSAATAIGIAALAIAAGNVGIGAETDASLSLSGGSLALQAADNTAAGLVLSAATLTLGSGAALAVSGTADLSDGSTISGPGQLATAGATTIEAGGITQAAGLSWVNRGTVAALGAVQSGAGESITNAAGAAFDLAADGAGVVGAGGVLVNAGTLAKLAGGGTSTVDAALTSTGTITVATGTLDLDGGGTIGGDIGGAGTLLFGGGDFSVGSSTAFGVDNLAIGGGAVTLGGTSTPADFAVAGAFALASGSVLLADSSVLTLNGPAAFTDGGSIGGAATLATSGAVTIAADGSSAAFANGLLWNNGGAVTALGQIDSAGAAPVTFDNAAGATFDLADDAAGIVDTGSVSMFDNAGTLAKTGGLGTSSLYTSVESIGTLLAASGTLALEFSASLAGTAGGTGGGTLLLVNGASSAGSLAISDDGSAVSVQLSSSYADWTNSGTVADAGQVLLGDSTNSGPSILYNAAGAEWDLTTDDAGLAARGQVLFTNAGTLAKTGGGGDSVVAFAFANSGLIDAASGTLSLLGAVSGGGTMSIEAGSTLELGHALGDGQTLAFNGAGATLLLDQPASIAGPIEGLGAGSGIDLAAVSVTGASVAGDVLSVTAADGTYTFTSSQSLAGLDAQVTSDGSGGSLVTLTLASLALDAARFLSAEGGDAATHDLLANGVFQEQLGSQPPPAIPTTGNPREEPVGGAPMLGTWPPLGNIQAAAHWTAPATRH